MDYQQPDSVQIFNINDLLSSEGDIPHYIEITISEQREFHFFHFSVYNSYTFKNIAKKVPNINKLHLEKN